MAQSSTHKSRAPSASPGVRARLGGRARPRPMGAEAGGLGSRVCQVQHGHHVMLQAPWQKPAQVRDGHTCTHCTWPAPTKVPAGVVTASEALNPAPG